MMLPCGLLIAQRVQSITGCKWDQSHVVIVMVYMPILLENRQTRTGSSTTPPSLQILQMVRKITGTGSCTLHQQDAYFALSANCFQQIALLLQQTKVSIPGVIVIDLAN